MLRMPLPNVRLMQQFARERDVETCAAALVHSTVAGQRYVVHDLSEVPPGAYASRTPVGATLRPEFCIELANRARAIGAGVLLAHTHPGEVTLEGFSSVDDAGEQALAAYFQRRLQGARHFSSVFTAKGAYAREIGHQNLTDIVAVGGVLVQASHDGQEEEQRYDRQVRAFGAEGQRALQSIKVAIIGLGGTGSVVAQLLAHLGVHTLVLVDPDRVEETNLNRLVGASAADIGASKVDVAARNILSINASATCKRIVADVVDDDVAAKLADVDFIFACTDSMASRAVLNQLAYQYLIPCVDVGVGIGVADGKVQYVTGRTQMLSPGLPCLVCTDKINADQVRCEMMTPEQRARDPYIVGASVPQPAVISLNSTMSSAAVTMFLAAVTGFPSDARMVIYDGVRGSLRPAAMEPRPNCIACSSSGALARGTSWTLPVRRRV